MTLLKSYLSPQAFQSMGLERSLIRLRAQTQQAEATKPPELRGAALKMFLDTGREVVISGAAGTGKSRACLE